MEGMWARKPHPYARNGWCKGERTLAMREGWVQESLEIGELGVKWLGAAGRALAFTP